MTGVITSIKAAGYGFLEVSDDNRDAFFNVRELGGGLTFDEQLVGQRVQFDLVQTEKGWKAKNLQPLD